MSPNSRAPVAIPILIIFVGVGWLLTAQGIISGVNWLWTLGLAGIGILTFVLSGIDKVSVVVGPLFILASVLSVLRQTDKMRIDIEVPILVISSGLLMLIALLPSIARPVWFVAPPSQNQGDQQKKLRL